MKNMQNMRNMQNIHSYLAVQQRIHFSVSSGNKSGEDLLEIDANSTMNHEIVTKSIDWLRRAQNLSAHHKEIKKYARFAKYDKDAKYIPGLSTRSEQGSEPFRHRQSRARLRRHVANGHLCSGV
jgi:hypothetical protein